MTTIYQQHGYNSRMEYLQGLADEYGVPLYAVITLASVIGENEDFDGLVDALEEVENMEL